jgi:hypothetical protein
MKITELFRRRRPGVRAKTANARQQLAGTDAMLTRRERTPQ